jgi:hypothetical protein
VSGARRTTAEHALGRRQVLRSGAAAGGAGLLGVTSMVLPTAVAAASDPTVAAVPAASLAVHLDASLPGESPSAAWFDRSGNGNGATPGTGVTFVAATGDAAAHYSFPGTSATQRTTVGTGAIVGTAGSPPTAYTKMVWFRRDTLTQTSNLASSPGGTGLATHYLYFIASGDYRRVTVGHTLADPIISSANVAASVWTFVAVTFSEAAGFGIHQNTSDRTWIASATIETFAYVSERDKLNAPIAFDIGAFGLNAINTLDGDVATLVVHSRALSDSEVKSYYAATVDRFHPV